ncbi:MAG: PAS domain-containing sensor histidine kinase [Desulfovibrio sp.]|jgi:two-component system phosphate regulon sensor histidine kinase PhoR|nr:PAS domain-containing sensor histidine kinase [Desulfovibrio sp.]
MISSPGSLQGRLFLCFALVTAIAAILPALFYRDALYKERQDIAGQQALSHASLVRSFLESRPGEERIQELFDAAGEMSLRLTLIDAAGQVTHDSRIGRDKLPEMDNHDDRIEVAEARSKGTGLSFRHSNSLGIEAAYAASALRDGEILRVAVPLADIRRGADREFSFLSTLVAGAAAFCLLLSVFITRRVRAGMEEMTEAVESVSLGKTHSRLHDVPGREFLPLAEAVNRMADMIEDFVRTTGDQRRQLESVLDSMHEGVLVLGPTGKVRRWNRALAALFPAVAQGEGKPLIESLPVPALQRRVDGLLAAGAGASGLRADSPLPAGITLQGEASNHKGNFGAAPPAPECEDAVHFELPPGRFLVAHLAAPVERNASLGAVIVVYDATQIMRLERARRDFVANVSHELRTPLTAVAGYAETLLTSEDLQPEYRNFAGVIHKHAVALGRIVGDMLALTRIENEREAVRPVPADAGAALEQALSFCREQADAKGITFAVTLDAGIVLADAALLAQVFRNLLENACRYSPPGGEIRVVSRREGEEALFIVADNGPGIPREALPRIFERFYQVNRERNSGTSGIGLAVCKHIIERHGGRIWAESPYGGAATAMLFTLPAAPSAAA